MQRNGAGNDTHFSNGACLQCRTANLEGQLSRHKFDMNCTGDEFLFRHCLQPPLLKWVSLQCLSACMHAPTQTKVPFFCNLCHCARRSCMPHAGAVQQPLLDAHVYRLWLTMGSMTHLIQTHATRKQKLCTAPRKKKPQQAVSL